MRSSYGAPSSATQRNERFARVVLPHLDAVHSLARSITGSGADADDVLQEATMRLLRFIHGYRGGDARSWVLRVARNTAFSWLRTNRRLGQLPQEDNVGGMWLDPARDAGVDECEDPFEMEARRREGEALRRAIDSLPREQQEIVVLRDLNGLQYCEIATALRIPIGTVMSRLSRARAVLTREITSHACRPTCLARGTCSGCARSAAPHRRGRERSSWPTAARR